MNFKTTPHIGLASMFLIQLLVCSTLNAQMLSAVALPDAPGTESRGNLSISSSSSNDLSSAGDQSTANPNPPPASDPSQSQGQQTKRILGIIPNFRAVSAGIC